MHGNAIDEVTAAWPHRCELRVIRDEAVENSEKGIGGNGHLMGSNSRPRSREKVHIYPTDVHGLRVRHAADAGAYGEQSQGVARRPNEGLL